MRAIILWIVMELHIIAGNNAPHRVVACFQNGKGAPEDAQRYDRFTVNYATLFAVLLSHSHRSIAKGCHGEALVGTERASSNIKSKKTKTH